MSRGITSKIRQYQRHVISFCLLFTFFAANAEAAPAGRSGKGRHGQLLAQEGKKKERKRKTRKTKNDETAPSQAASRSETEASEKSSEDYKGMLNLTMKFDNSSLETTTETEEESKSSKQNSSLTLLTLEYLFILKNLAIGPSISYQAEGGDGNTMTSTGISGTGIFHFGDLDGVSMTPYLLGSVGMSQKSMRDTSLTGYAFKIGLGAHFFLGPQVSVSPRFRIQRETISGESVTTTKSDTGLEMAITAFL